MTQKDGDTYHVLGWNNQYCENDYSTQSYLWIQCNPYQITNGIFHIIRTKNFAICMETQKTHIAKAILRKKNGAGRIRLPDFRLYYKATSNQDSMVLPQKQKYRTTEQDRKSRDKPVYLWSPNL